MSCPTLPIRSALLDVARLALYLTQAVAQGEVKAQVEQARSPEAGRSTGPGRLPFVGVQSGAAGATRGRSRRVIVEEQPRSRPVSRPVPDPRKRPGSRSGVEHIPGSGHTISAREVKPPPRCRTGLFSWLFGKRTAPATAPPRRGEAAAIAAGFYSAGQEEGQPRITRITRIGKNNWRGSTWPLGSQPAFFSSVLSVSSVVLFLAAVIFDGAQPPLVAGASAQGSRLPSLQGGPGANQLLHLTAATSGSFKVLALCAATGETGR
jgi:hypothetical protein